MEQPLATVSVVLATNRAGPFLREAVESVWAQTVRPTELIVVDDLSPHPKQIAAVAAGMPHTRVVGGEGIGVSAARNLGASLAAGQWLAFIDDDDRWDSSRLERQLGDLGQRPDAVVGYCGLRTIDETGKALAVGDHVQVDGRLDVMRQRTGILVPNSIVSTAVFREVGGFDSRYRYAEDLDLMLRLAERGALVLTAADLVDYRLHAANTTGRHRDLCAGVADVLGAHRERARAAHDFEAVDAIDVGLRANRRYAWWRAMRAGRGVGGVAGIVAATRETFWAMRFAPAAPVDIVARRLRR